MFLKLVAGVFILHSQIHNSQIRKENPTLPHLTALHYHFTPLIIMLSTLFREFVKFLKFTPLNPQKRCEAI